MTKIYLQRENECRFSGKGSRRDTEAMVITYFVNGYLEHCLDKMMGLHPSSMRELPWEYPS